MAEVNVGEIVKAHARSGTYVGKVIEDRGDRYLIEILAVLKHPLQGDLHNLNKLEDVFFHERKALAHHEKTNIKKAAVHLYDEKVPEYIPSLKESVQIYREKLEQETSAYNVQALRTLNKLEDEVYRKLY